MKILPQDLNEAVSGGIVSSEQSLKLQDFFNKKNMQRSIDLFQTLYYLGGLTIICTLSYVLFDQWEKQQTLILFLSLAFITLLLILSAHFFQNTKKIAIPARTCSFLSLLSCYGCLSFLATLLHWDTPLPAGLGHLKSEWILFRNASLPGIGTILLSLYMLIKIDFPFQTFAFFFLIKNLWDDLLSFLIRYENWAPMQAACPTCPPFAMIHKAGVFFGLIAIYVATRLEQKDKSAEAFWTYLFAGIAIITSFNSATYDFSQHHILAFLSFFFYLGLLTFSLVMRQSSLSIIGLIGLGDLIYFLLNSYFKNSTLFPLFLTIIGCGIIYAGVYYRRNQNLIEEKLFFIFNRNKTNHKGVS